MAYNSPSPVYFRRRALLPVTPGAQGRLASCWCSRMRLPFLFLSACDPTEPPGIPGFIGIELSQHCGYGNRIWEIVLGVKGPKDISSCAMQVSANSIHSGWFSDNLLLIILRFSYLNLIVVFQRIHMDYIGKYHCWERVHGRKCLNLPKRHIWDRIKMLGLTVRSKSFLLITVFCS